MPGYVERNGILHFKQMANMLIYDLQRFGFVLFPNSMNTKTFVTVNAGEDSSEILVNGAGSGEFEIVPKYTTCATLAAGPTVDPLASTQSWRIRIDANCDYAKPDANGAVAVATKCVVKSNDPGFMRVFVTHPLQLDDKGGIVQEYLGFSSSKSYPRYAGELTAGYINGQSWGGGLGNTTNKLTLPFASAKFFQKTGTSNDWQYGDIHAHPYSYMLSVSDRGVAFVCWKEAQDDYGNRFSWFVVQRPVDPLTGETLADESKSKCPVFCIYSIGGGDPDDVVSLPKAYDIVGTTGSGDIYSNLVSLTDSETSETQSPYQIPGIYRFTVRESDVFKPTTPVLATVDSPDNRAVMNGKQQVAIAEDGRYVIFYPNGFNTDRYMYREEVDTLVYTSADVISQWQEVNLMPYPGKPRIYKACLANITNNRGMRVLLMAEQPGVMERLADCIDPAIVETQPALPFVTDIVVSGPPTVNSNSRSTFSAVLTLDNTQPLEGSNSVVWTATAGEFEANTFIAPVVKTSTSVTVTATYDNVTANPSVTKTAVVTVAAAVVKSIAILGSTSLVSGSKASYAATLLLSDNSTTTNGASLVTWTASAGTFAGNMYTAPTVAAGGQPVTVTITATYDNATVTDAVASFTVTVSPAS